MTAVQNRTPETAIRTFVTAVESYVARLRGPGIAPVLDGIRKWKTGPVKPPAAKCLPVCDHLDAALRSMDRPSLVKAIAGVQPFLRWVTYDAYPRAEIGGRFADNHAFASVIGEGCALEAVDFDLGIFLIGPNVFYRDHHHAAPELYMPLTGPHGWRFKPGEALLWREAHQPVWNEPWQPHATMTSATPFLALFCWTKDTSLPAKVIPSADWPTLENSL